jgi:hypothetical protein
MHKGRILVTNEDDGDLYASQRYRLDGGSHPWATPCQPTARSLPPAHPAGWQGRALYLGPDRLLEHPPG